MSKRVTKALIMMTDEWAAKCGNVPNAEEADLCHFRNGCDTGFPMVCSRGESRKPGCAESKPYWQVSISTVSNVIYQSCM